MDHQSGTSSANNSSSFPASRLRQRISKRDESPQCYLMGSLHSRVYLSCRSVWGWGVRTEEQQQVTIINNLNTLYKTQFALVGDNDENQMGISIVGQFVLLLL